MIDVRLAITDSPPPGILPVRIACRAHGGDNETSMAVYHDHIHCFSCGYHNAKLDSCIFFLKGAGQDIKKYYSVNVLAEQRRVTEAIELDPLPKQFARMYNGFLNTGGRAHRKPWLLDRGLTQEMIDQYLLGHDGTRFTIPIFSKRGELMTFRFRRDDIYGKLDYHEQELPKYSGIRGRNGLYLYPANTLYEDTRDYVVVCEGELDALRLRQEGINACSPTGGAGSFKHVARLLQGFRRIRKVYLASDMDEAGNKACVEFMEAADSRWICEVLRWDEQYKDITELYKAGHEIKL